MRVSGFLPPRLPAIKDEFSENVAMSLLLASWSNVCFNSWWISHGFEETEKINIHIDIDIQVSRCITKGNASVDVGLVEWLPQRTKFGYRTNQVNKPFLKIDDGSNNWHWWALIGSAYSRWMWIHLIKQWPSPFMCCVF